MNSCIKLTQGGWVPLQDTLEGRYDHSSMVVGEKILLIGGLGSSSTTELVPLDGGASVPSVRLQPGRERHCGIPVSHNTVILTGGRFTRSMVTEMTVLGEGSVRVGGPERCIRAHVA